MVDISMCLNEECPSKWKCHRFTANPNTHWQTYVAFEVPSRRKKCDDFIPNKGRVKQQRAVLAGIQSLEDMESGPRYRSRIAKLEDALLPFAALLQEHNKVGPGEQPIFGINDAVITRGDLRKAALLLKEKP